MASITFYLMDFVKIGYRRLLSENTKLILNRLKASVAKTGRARACQLL